MDKDGGNKTQRLYRCGVNYALSKPIVNNWLEDLWITKNPYSFEFTRYDKSSTTQENIRILRLKKNAMKLLQKRNFKLEIRPVIENLQDELYQLENKQAKGAKLCANIR